MTSRTLKFINNSTAAGSFMVFQVPQADAHSLAWFARYAYPGTTLSFDWDDTAYAFVWSANGQITPGIAIAASQFVPAELAGGSQIKISYDVTHRTFNLHDKTSGPRPGTFMISTDSTLPLNAVAIGIAMAGAPCFVMQGLPNMNYTFQPKSEYWIAFGNFQQGEVLDVDAITAPVKVEFPINVVSLTATLNADMTWTIASNILAAKDEETA